MVQQGQPCAGLSRKLRMFKWAWTRILTNGCTKQSEKQQQQKTMPKPYPKLRKEKGRYQM